MENPFLMFIFCLGLKELSVTGLYFWAGLLEDLGKFVLPLKVFVTPMQVLGSQEQALELEEIKSVKVRPLPVWLIP